MARRPARRCAQPVAALSTPDARAASVLDLLLERGVTVPASVQAEVTATLREVGDAGDLLTCVDRSGGDDGGDLIQTPAFDLFNETVSAVTARDSAHSCEVSTQVQNTCGFWLLSNFGCVGC